MKHSFVTVDSSDDDLDHVDKRKQLGLPRFVSIGSPSTSISTDYDTYNKNKEITDVEIRPRKSDGLLDASHRSKLLTDDSCGDMKISMNEIEDSTDSGSIINISEINSNSVTGTSGNSISNNTNSNNSVNSVTEAKLVNIGENYTNFSWHNVSPLVLFGYRTNYSIKQILLSIIAIDPKNKFGIIHNEFINIWTEVIPGIFYLFVVFSWISANYNIFIYSPDIYTGVEQAAASVLLDTHMYGVHIVHNTTCMHLVCTCSDIMCI